MDELPILAVVVGGLLLTTLVALPLIAARLYLKVEPGFALVVNRTARVDVSFTAALVIPVVHRADTMDIRTKTVTIERRGKHGIICRDNIRADIRAIFHVRVRPTTDDVVRVAQSIGCARVGDPQALEELFSAKFSEGLKRVAKQLDFEEISVRREEFKDEVLEVIGTDLNGFVLEDLAIDELRQTPLAELDPNDILDADGIRKIVERTTEHERRRRQITHDAEREAVVRRLELDEIVIELERRKADALARFRDATGRELTEATLKERLDERVRELVRPLVQELVEDMRARALAPRTGE